eukprot:7964849-Ditylum_brightwellii.AAC.1
MEAVLKDYILKKSEIITAINIKTLLKRNLSANIPKELACKVLGYKQPTVVVLCRELMSF